MRRTRPVTRLGSREALLREAIETAGEIGNDWLRSRALRKLVPLLPPELHVAALVMARGISEPGARARALNDLAHLLDVEDKELVLAEALTASRGIQEAAARGAALAAAAAQMDGESAEFTGREAFQALRNSPDLGERAFYLSQLPDALADEALAEVHRLPQGWAQASALAALAGRYAEGGHLELFTEALYLARGLPETSMRALLVGELVEVAGEALQPELAREAIESALTSGEDSVLANATIMIAGLIPADLLPQVLRAVHAIRDRSLRASTLIALAPSLEPDERQEAVAMAFKDAKSLTDDWSCAATLYPLAGLLDETQHEQALALIHGFTDEWAKAEALGDMSEHFPEERKSQILARALSAARRAPSAWSRAQALGSVASHL